MDINHRIGWGGCGKGAVPPFFFCCVKKGRQKKRETVTKLLGCHAICGVCIVTPVDVAHIVLEGITGFISLEDTLFYTVKKTKLCPRFKSPPSHRHDNCPTYIIPKRR